MADNARVVDYDLGQVAGAALYSDGYQGKARVLVDQERGVLIGMTLVGPAVGELIHGATIAIVGAIPISRLWHAVPSYPTISEIWLRLLKHTAYEHAPDFGFSDEKSRGSRMTGRLLQ